MDPDQRPAGRAIAQSPNSGLSSREPGGQSAFADNCAPCHGLGGAGQDIYPTLADDD
ncbi:MAG: c-type cytochrome, partial [Verrucomicrobiota bacterium]